MSPTECFRRRAAANRQAAAALGTLHRTTRMTKPHEHPCESCDQQCAAGSDRSPPCLVMTAVAVTHATEAADTPFTVVFLSCPFAAGSIDPKSAFPFPRCLAVTRRRQESRPGTPQLEGRHDGGSSLATHCRVRVARHRSRLERPAHAVMRRRRPYRYCVPLLAWDLRVFCFLLRPGCCRGGQGEHGQAPGFPPSRPRPVLVCNRSGTAGRARAAAAAVLAWRRLSRRHGAPMMTFAHEWTRPRGRSADSPAVTAAVARLGRHQK